ncbi:MAG TPA: FtsQ-type POTRA domain-containing protein [Clostridia bacterium]|nr:FtsQ-type POTRA domain-containing protein [Clostridia bacterium]
MDKRVITIIIFFAVLAVLLIIGATVFVVRDVEVSFATAEESNVITSDEIITASQISTGKNIFAISETRAVSNIEQAYPAVKVINIERKFPSTIIVHITARIPVMAVKISGQDKYAMLDREMFVMQIVSADELVLREVQYKRALTKTNYELQAKDVALGEIILEKASIMNVLSQHLIVAFEKQGLLNKEFSDFIVNINIVQEAHSSAYNLTLKTRTGVDIMFEDGDFDEKVAMAYSWYCDEIERKGSDSDTVTSGYIIYNNGVDNQGYFSWYRYQG